MEHSYTPLSAVEITTDQEISDNGLFETAFDQYQSADHLQTGYPTGTASRRASNASCRASGASRRASNTSSRASNASTIEASKPSEPLVPSTISTLAPLPANVSSPSTHSSRIQTLQPPDYNFLSIPTGKSREPTPSRSPSPSFNYDRCVSPGTVQQLLQQDATLDCTQSEEYNVNAGDLWTSNSEIKPLSCWQRIRRPLARAIGIITAIVLSGCAGEMCALGAVWRGTSTAVAALIALILDALWAAEAIAAVVGPPHPGFGLVRRAARRARTPFYAIVALLLIIEGVGKLRWAAVALSILAAAMRAAAWCGRRSQRTGLLLPYNRSFTAPIVHYDAQIIRRSYSPTPSIRTPMDSYPSSTSLNRPKEPYSDISGTPIMLRPIKTTVSRPTTPIPPRLGSPSEASPSPTAGRPPLIVEEQVPRSGPPLLPL